MLTTDWASPATPVLARVNDRGAAQFWDPSHLLAIRLAADARPPQPKQKCCVRNGVLWDLAALYPAGEIWDAAVPPAVFFNGAIERVKTDLEHAIEALPK
jgi:hypothetical protein